MLEGSLLFSSYWYTYWGSPRRLSSQSLLSIAINLPYHDHGLCRSGNTFSCPSFLMELSWILVIFVLNLHQNLGLRSSQRNVIDELPSKMIRLWVLWRFGNFQLNASFFLMSVFLPTLLLSFLLSMEKIALLELGIFSCMCEEISIIYWIFFIKRETQVTTLELSLQGWYNDRLVEIFDFQMAVLKHATYFEASLLLPA